jgi:hypothetical protein
MKDTISRGILNWDGPHKRRASFGGGGRGGRGGWYHASLTPIKRSQGRSAVAAAAYRTGTKMQDRTTLETADYSRRSGVLDVFTIAPAEAPEWAHDPEQLANAMEEREKRKDSQVSFEWTIALPAAVSPEARRKIAHDFTAEMRNRYGMASIVALHAPDEEGDERNYHAHVLSTTRRMDAEGLTDKVAAFRGPRGKPSPEVTHMREYLATLINDALADADSDERVDHRSFAERGIADLPSEHLGPIATEIERDGRESIKGDINRDIERHNEAIAEAEAQIEQMIAELTVLEAGIVDAEERELDRRYGAEETRGGLAEWVERQPGPPKLAEKREAGEEAPGDVRWDEASVKEVKDRAKAYERLRAGRLARPPRVEAPPAQHAPAPEPHESHAADSWAGRHAPEPRREPARPPASAAEAGESGTPPQVVPQPARPARALDAAWERTGAEQPTEAEPGPDRAPDRARDIDEPDMD